MSRQPRSGRASAGASTPCATQACRLSAGMDMALAFTASLLGREAAEGIARFAEYSGSWVDGDDDPWGRSAA